LFTNLSNTSFDSDLGITVYPNPAVDLVKVKTANTLEDIKLYDIQGRIISSYSNFENAFDNTLDVTSLSKGMYFIKIKTAEDEVTKKLIKK